MKFEVELPDNTIKDLKEALIFVDDSYVDLSDEDVITEMFYMDTCDARGVVKVRVL